MSDITDSLIALLPDGRQQGLPSPPERPRIQRTVGVSASRSSSTSNSAGIASPLTEVSRVTQTRRIYDEFEVWYVDVEVVTQLNLVDANGRDVVMILKPGS